MTQHNTRTRFAKVALLAASSFSSNVQALSWGAGAPLGVCEFSPTAPVGGITKSSCKQYIGADWTVETATADCQSLTGGKFATNSFCDESTVGLCKVNQYTGSEVDFVYYEGTTENLEDECYNQVSGSSYVPAVPIPTASGDLLPEAQTAIQSDSKVTVTSSNNRLVFAPASGSNDGGFVYFPNSNIEAAAYAVMARAIAEYGYLVVVVSDPSNKVVAEEDATAVVESTMDTFTSVSRWAVGGNGRGAIAAAAAAYNNPKGLVESLALHDGGLSREKALREADLRVYYFTSESRGQFEFVSENFIKIRMPRNKASQYADLAGRSMANYAFSSATVPNDFLGAFLSKSQQVDMVTRATVHMLKNFGLDRSVSAVFEKSHAKAQATGCSSVQQKAFKVPNGLSIGGLYSDREEFVTGVPKVYSPDNGSYLGNVAQVANADDVTAPAVYYETALCKVFSLSGVEKLFGKNVSGSQASNPCKEANKDIFNAGKKRVSFTTSLTYNIAFAKVNYADDVVVQTMEEFENPPVQLVKRNGPKDFTITGVRLENGNDDYVQCRIWSEPAVVQLVEAVVTVQRPSRDPLGRPGSASDSMPVEAIVGGTLGGVFVIGAVAAAVVMKRTKQSELLESFATSSSMSSYKMHVDDVSTSENVRFEAQVIDTEL